MASEVSLAQSLATRLQDLRIDRMPTRAIEMAKIAITDTIGCALAGATEPCATLLLDTVCATDPRGAATLFGMPQRAGILDAALVNGTAAHAIDLDDMAAAMGGHPSVPLVPVVFALGEKLGASGGDVLEAYIVGFEVECKLGRVVHPHHYERGWHPTSTLGVFGACAAAARLLKLDIEQTATALGLCASMASGVKANFGTMTKPFHVGHCARDGLMAALLADRGYTASNAALEHKQGFFAAYDGLDHVQTDRLFENWGEPLEIDHPMFGLKQFPCCGSTHGAVMSMLSIRERHAPAAPDVDRIDITAHRRRLPHTHNPFPQSPLQAKFSIQYATVRALLDGPPRIADFEGDAFLQPEVGRLLERVRVEPYPTVSDGLADEMKAEVIVTLRDGTRLHGEANALGRGPSNPMTQEEMWHKFSDCAANVLPSAQARQAFEALGRLEQALQIEQISRYLAPTRP